MYPGIFMKEDSRRYIQILSCFIYPVIVLLAGILTYKNIISSTGPAFQMRDIQAIVFPKYFFLRKAFIAGEFPLWDPHTMLGQPGIFNLGFAMLYPFTLVFLSLGFLGPLLPRHLELFIVGHLLLSGLTMYWGARKLGLSRLGACAAGIIFQMAIINKDLIFAVEYVMGLPWIPLAISFGIILFRSKEPLLSKKNFLPLLVVTASLFLIISTTSPNIILYTFLSLGLAVMFYIVTRIKEKNWSGIIVLFKKAVWVFVIPLLLNAIIIIPGYVILKDSVRYSASFYKVGVMYLTHIWTMFFPGFANSIQPSYTYIGIIPLMLAIFFCITRKNKSVNGSFLFIILAVFWFYYSIQGSLLEMYLAYLPILKNIRNQLFSLIIYVYAVSILAGMGLERICKFQECKIRLNINWLFPVYIIFILLYSISSFISLYRDAYSIDNMTVLFFGYIFLLYLIFHVFITPDKVRAIFSRVIPLVVILEIFVSSPYFIPRSDAEELIPYKYQLDRFASDFPECFLNKDLYKFENFSEYIFAEYYFDRYSTYGFSTVGTHPARYHYLWDESGKAGWDYGKYDITANEKFRVMPISLDSKLYDLMGVKYFYLPEHEWLLIDFTQSGKGEWIEFELEKEVLISGIKIYNPPDPADNWKNRRIIKATIVLNGEKEINVEIPDREGWHSFYFEPVVIHKLRIIADDVSPLELGIGTIGVIIGEVELLDMEGRKINVPVKNFNASSTMRVCQPSYIMDNRLHYAWESWCDVVASRVLPSNTLERVRGGCYINKNVLPRAFMVHRYRYVEDKSELLQELHSEDFEPGEVILLEEEPFNYDIPQGPYSDSVEITKYKLNEVEITVKNNKPGFLLLTDMYSPGWQVFVDGKKDKILIADGLFRGVFITEGEHEVIFKYTPPLLRLGFAVSLAALFFIVVVLYRMLRR